MSQGRADEMSKQLRSREGRDLETTLVMLESAEAVAGIGSWEFRPDESDLVWSDNLFRILGFEPGAFRPSLERLYELAHPDDLAALEAEVDRVVASPSPRPPIDFRAIKPGGAVVHLRGITAKVDGSRGAHRIVGSVQDRSETFRSEREIAAHIAVASALTDWEALGDGGERLLRKFAEAMKLDRGAIWIPDDDVLAARVTWRAGGAPEREVAEVRKLRIPRGVGMSGTAWARRGPVSVSDVTSELAYSYRPAAVRAGLRGAIAFPALCGEEVLAVFGFAGREPIELTERLTDCLLSIGTEIGRFLSRRRGELRPPVLSRRETEVLQLAAEGNPGPRIAERLHISVATVRTHFEHIYEKLEVSDRGTAVATALREGLIR
jgi:DNA-binding NarL/FixJ family response regulator